MLALPRTCGRAKALGFAAALAASALLLLVTMRPTDATAQEGTRRNTPAESREHAGCHSCRRVGVWPSASGAAAIALPSASFGHECKRRTAMRASSSPMRRTCA